MLNVGSLQISVSETILKKHKSLVAIEYEAHSARWNSHFVMYEHRCCDPRWILENTVISCGQSRIKENSYVDSVHVTYIKWARHNFPRIHSPT